PSNGPRYETTTVTDSLGAYAFLIAVDAEATVAAYTSVAVDAVPGKAIPQQLSCSESHMLGCGGEASASFGFAASCTAARFAGVVYCDDNGNLDRNDGEDGIASVPVTLHVDPSDGPNYEMTTFTAADGTYAFSIPIDDGKSASVYASVPT